MTIRLLWPDDDYYDMAGVSFVAMSQRPRNKAAELSASPLQTKTAVERKIELANCRLIYVLVFSIFSPIVSYSYTGRFKALVIFIAVALISFSIASQVNPTLSLKSKRAKLSVSVCIIALATVENATAILLARKRLAVAKESLSTGLYKSDD